MTLTAPNTQRAFTDCGAKAELQTPCVLHNAQPSPAYQSALRRGEGRHSVGERVLLRQHWTQVLPPKHGDAHSTACKSTEE